MRNFVFALGQPVPFEESLTCEFKEVKGPAVQTIGKAVDEYVVAYLNERGGSIYWGIRNKDRTVVGVRLDDKARDEVRQVIGQKIAAIAPPFRRRGTPCRFIRSSVLSMAQ
jgi:predicted HTH transcriptional regulator